MKKKAFVVALVMCLSASVAWAAVTGTNSLTFYLSWPKVTSGGQNGPWRIGGEGDVSLDSSMIGWSGLQFYVTDPSNPPKTTYGYTNLPKGAPKQGGAALPWTGTVGGLTVKGSYSVVAKMEYVDSTMNPTTKTTQSNVNVP